MPTYRLNISIEINEEDDQWARATATHILDLILPEEYCSGGKSILFRETTKVALTRDGDRGGLNILLPKLSGRCGEHYQGRRATISEVLEKK